MGRKRKEVPVDEIKTLYFEGLTLRQIAKIYKVSHQLIKNRLQEENIIRRKLRYMFPNDK